VEHNVDVVEDFLVVGHLAFDDARVLNDPLVAKLGFVNLSVD